MTSTGIKVKGTPNAGRNPVYRSVAGVKVHRLVWAAWGSRPIQPGEII